MGGRAYTVKAAAIEITGLKSSFHLDVIYIFRHGKYKTRASFDFHGNSRNKCRCCYEAACCTHFNLKLEKQEESITSVDWCD